VAKYAILRALATGQKVFYTTPLERPSSTPGNCAISREASSELPTQVAPKN